MDGIRMKSCLALTNGYEDRRACALINTAEAKMGPVDPARLRGRSSGLPEVRMSDGDHRLHHRPDGDKSGDSRFLSEFQ